MSVKVGVVGLGWPGKQHTESLAKVEGATIAAFADLDSERVKQFAEQYGAHAYGDWREMLHGEKDLDAVILATPVVVRLEPIRALCKRKIALFCEKPPAKDLRTGRKIAALIAQAGIINSVGLQFRWHETAQRMRQLINGRHSLFARLVVAWPVFDWLAAGLASQALWKIADCGGPMIEQGIHYQDLLRFITADEPVCVQGMAEIGSIHPSDQRDCQETTAVIVHHASGMLTSHIHNWSHRGRQMSLQVTGVDFDLTWQMTEPDRLVGRVGEQKIDETFNSPMHLEEIRGFVEAVRRHDQGLIRSSYADACQSLAVCVAAAKSVASGRIVSVEQSAR